MNISNLNNFQNFDIDKAIQSLLKDNITQKYKHEKKSFAELIDYVIELEIVLYNQQKQLENNKFEIVQLSQILIDKDSEIIEYKIRLNHLENKERIHPKFGQNLPQTATVTEKHTKSKIETVRERENLNTNAATTEESNSVLVDLSLDKQENQSLLSKTNSI